MPIEGKVVKIIDERHVLLNRGWRDGVRHGMRFSVLAAMDEVQDLETGEPLGRWEAVKARLLAVHVQERLALLTPAEPQRPPETDMHQTLSAEMVRVSMPANSGAQMQIDRSQMLGMPRLAPVRIGDPVRQAE